MQIRNRRKWLPYILCMALVVALALAAAGCSGREDKSSPNAGSQSEGGVMGEGQRMFYFTAVDLDGKETKFEIHTDKETVGEALEELGIIQGEEGEFGLYVKTVNGITLDFDADGKYWAFYIGEEYAMESVDLTAITEGESYSLRAE
ncbi:MAG: DUF4430 domain-containing protein [Lachnospiraceae bacterium]|nr:DUF4430 domain-containing protein [Lachnospiraceae bacterium]